MISPRVVYAWVLLAYVAVAAELPGQEHHNHESPPLRASRQRFHPTSLTEIATALSATVRGDTLLIPAGVHRVHLVIGSRMVLKGEPGAILDGGGTGTVVRVMADSVVISSLRIIGSGKSLDDDDAALRFDGCTGCAAERLIIDRPLHGIYLAGSTDIRLLHNTITGDPSVAEGRRGNGIHLFDSNNNRITGNNIRGTRDGIYFSFASSNEVDSNTVMGVRYGLHYMYSNDNTFANNSFSRNAAGGAIMFSDRILLRGNTFSEHVGNRAYGLLLQTTMDVVVEENRFSGNLIGLFVDNSTRTLLRGNEIVDNGIGVDLLPSSRDNTFVGNWFLSNRTPVRIARGSGKSTWAEDGRGNYWGNRSTFDLNGDGVGDRPMKVGDAYATLAQARPALELFTGTPAALALSWAEEAMPAFELLRVEDPAPLVQVAERRAASSRMTLFISAAAGIAMITAFTFVGMQLTAPRRRTATTAEGALS